MWTLQDAKNKFSTVVAAALAGQPQEVTKRGKPAVVVIASDDYHRLLNEAGGNRGRFVDHLRAFPDGQIEAISAKPRDVEF